MGLLSSIFGGSKKTTTSTSTTNAVQNTLDNTGGLYAGDGSSIDVNTSSVVNETNTADNRIDNSIWSDSSIRDSNNTDNSLTNSNNTDNSVYAIDNTDNSVRAWDNSVTDNSVRAWDNSVNDSSVRNSGNTDNSVRAWDNSVNDNSVWSIDRSDSSVRAYDNSRTSYVDNSVRYDASSEVLSDIVAYTDSQNRRLLDSVDALSANGLATSREVLSQGNALQERLTQTTRDTVNSALAAIDRNTGSLVSALLEGDARQSETFQQSTAAIVAANRSDGQQVLATVENLGKGAMVMVGAIALFAALRN